LLDNQFKFHAFILAYQTWLKFSFIIAVVGAGISIYGKHKSKNIMQVVGAYMLFQMVASILLYAMLFNVFESRVKSELMRKIKLYVGAIQICDKEYNNDQALVFKEMLLGMKNFSNHHSTQDYCGTISCNTKDEKITLRVERDFNISTEYWLYWDKYEAISITPISKLRTVLLNKMNCP
jgi:hypothetical protein